MDSHGDAAAMLRTVVHTARAFYSTRIAAAFGRASFIDLPCQVCELAGVLGAVKLHRSALATAGATGGALPTTAVRPVDDVDWLLGRLPLSPAGLKDVSKSLKLQRSKVKGRGNGLDLQCAGQVAKSWLRSGPPRLRSSLLEVTANGRGGPFTLSPATCQKCRGVLDVSMNSRLLLCGVCRTLRRQTWDAKRQRIRRS